MKINDNRFKKYIEENYISKKDIKNKIVELSNVKGDFATHIAVSERINVLLELLNEKEKNKYLDIKKVKE